MHPESFTWIQAHNYYLTNDDTRRQQHSFDNSPLGSQPILAPPTRRQISSGNIVQRLASADNRPMPNLISVKILNHPSEQQHNWMSKMAEKGNKSERLEFLLRMSEQRHKKLRTRNSHWLRERPSQKQKLIVSGPSRKQESTIPGPSRNQEPTIPGPSRKQDPTVLGPLCQQELSVPGPSREPKPTIPGHSREQELTVPGPSRKEQDLTVQGYSEELNPTIPEPLREQELTVPGPSRDQELTVPGPSRDRELPVQGPSREQERTVKSKIFIHLECRFRVREFNVLMTQQSHNSVQMSTVAVEVICNACSSNPMLSLRHFPFFSSSVSTLHHPRGSEIVSVPDA
uniref:Uncharacterized protein n=1 Tax=Timema bartmani TaxID=61472 RepID=A0A7R9I0E0_9NEOP|nr:unnamed protein product [Timema bartmani]